MLDGLKLLIWKNVKVQSRNRLTIAAEIFLPCLLVLCLGLLHSMMKVKHHTKPVVYESFSVREIPDVVRNQTSIIYYAPSNHLTDSIMETVNDKFFKSQGLNYTFRKTADLDELISEFSKERTEWFTRNLTRGPLLGGIHFENLQWGVLPKDIKYTIKLPSAQRSFYAVFAGRGGLKPSWQTEVDHQFIRKSGAREWENSHGGFPGYFDEGFLYLQFSVDSAIMEKLLKPADYKSFENLDLRLERFPFPAFQEEQSDVLISLWGAFMVATLYSFPLMNLTRQIIQEKSSRLKEFLKIMGLKSWLHWLAWFIESYSIQLVSGVLIVIACKISFQDGVCFLQHSDQAVLFLCFASFSFTVVAFAFLASTLFDTPEAGATATGFSWILLCFPHMRYFTAFEETSSMNKLASCLLGGPVPLGHTWLYISTFERQGVGLQWENLWEGCTSKDELSVGVMIVAMLVTGTVHMLLAFYIELAFPGQYGVRIPWYFPFTTWFWTGDADPREKSVLVRPSEAQNGNFEAQPEDLPVGVEFVGLTKAFSTRVAVRNLNFKIYENQVTSLLGHNGAGKTTTMSMLTGLLRPSSGTAYVNGMNIRTEMGKIRKGLGLCPQTNILFDNLTVEEHLKFYCALKGMSKAEAEDEVDRCLALLRIEDQRTKFAKHLSAGTKRKLCVGMAFSAGAKMVLLDEPTAGMDPIGRRSTWDIIQSEKAGRTVILSTHYMEEADILGDRIAIMADGQLQCCGSSVFLKRKYGEGCKLTIVKQDHANVEDIKEMVFKSVPNATFTDETGQELKCILPAKSDGSFCPLFDDLEANRNDLDIITYGVTPSTMEEVFIRVGEEFERSSKKKNNREESTDENPGNMMESTRQLYTADRDCNVGCKLWLQQLKAMVIKRALMNVRRMPLLALQIVIPLFVSLIVQWVLSHTTTMSSPRSRTVSFQDYGAVASPTIILKCSGNKESPCHSLQHLLNGTAKFELAPDEMPLVPYLVEKTESSLWKMESDYLFAVEEKVPENMNSSNRTQLTVYFNNQFFHVPPLALNMMMNTLVNHFGKQNYLTVKNHPFDYSPEEESFSYPGFAGPLFGSYTLMGGGAFLAASMIISPALERLSNFKHLQIIAGVRLWIYWLAEMLVNAVVYGVCMIILILSSNIIIHNDMEEWDVRMRNMIVAAAFGCAVIPMTMLLSIAASSAAKGYSKMLSFLIVSGVAGVFGCGLLKSPEFELEDIGKGLEWAFLLSPTYAFSNGVTHVGLNYIASHGCSRVNLTSTCVFQPESLCCTVYRENYFAWDGYGAGRNITYMLALGGVSILLLILIEMQVYQKTKLLFSGRLCSCLKRSQPNQTGGLELRDADVNEESRRVNHSTLSCLSFTDPLVFRNLTKSFDGKNVVSGLSFGVHKGEVFGLLGVNGSGKTETFRMLTGSTEITSGDAFIGSYSVQKQTRKAHRHLGYCPQSDAFIMELTGRETLTMFARLKGMKETNIPDLIEDVASKLLFSRYLDKQIGTYSGGNKRKLSAAVAMLGYPEVVIFDEPTAGIDPVAKFHVWEAVAGVRNAGTSVIIASQDMDECEALCSRIGIISNGQLQCIGTPQYLKSRLNSGYKLVVQLNCSACGGGDTTQQNVWEIHSSWRSQKEEFGKFMSERLSGCVLKEDHVGYLEYSVPAEGITWSRIFGAMEDAAFASKIEGFCVGQAGLQEVFFRYGQQS